MLGCMMDNRSRDDAPSDISMCIVKFQYATSAMLTLPYVHCLVSLLFLDVPITILLTSFLNVFFI